MKKLLFYIFLLSSFKIEAQQVQLLYHWEDNSLPSSVAHNNTYNEVWGFKHNGREYGVIGSTMGTHFFDVTDKNNITYIDYIAGKAQGGQIIHRDYHDYNGYLYAVCDEGASSLQIMDLNYLPDSVSLVYDSDLLVVNSHNIFIDSTSAKLFVCDGDIDVYSLTNPLSPSYFTSINLPSHAHDLYVRNDTAFVNAGPDGLYIFNASVLNPAPLNTLSVYPQKGYNHSGWLSSDGNTYIFADETHGKQMKVLDVSDLNNLTVLSTFMTMSDPNSIAHNQIIKGDYLYAAQYFDGFFMYDISDPLNVTEVGSYSTSTQPVNPSKYEGAWGIYPYDDGKVLVSDMQNGLFVLDVVSVLSVSDGLLEDIKIEVFPNPTESTLTIKADNYEIKSFEVVDLYGKIIDDELYRYRNNRIDLSSLIKGIYFIKFSNGESTLTKKVIRN